MIGVLPAYQGKGFARRHIHHLHTLSESDPGSTGVYLSTENSVNVSLYEHLGYRIIGEARVGDIHTWRKFRDNMREGQ